MTTQITFTCANCGATASVSSADALKLPVGWYTVCNGLLGAYTCSWYCLVTLGPTLTKRPEARS